jgi:hypothetical protein
MVEINFGLKLGNVIEHYEVSQNHAIVQDRFVHNIVRKRHWDIQTLFKTCFGVDSNEYYLLEIYLNKSQIGSHLQQMSVKVNKVSDIAKDAFTKYVDYAGDTYLLLSFDDPYICIGLFSISYFYAI